MKPRELRKLNKMLIMALLVTYLSFSQAYAWSSGTQNATNVKSEEVISQIYITKSLTGDYPAADETKDFKFTLKLTDAEGAVTTHEFTLSNNQTVSFDIQDGTKYELTEASYTSEYYTAVTLNPTTGTAGTDPVKITFVNKYEKKDSGGSGGDHPRPTPDPDKPDTPDTPDEPDSSDEPDNPDEPVTPDKPDSGNKGDTGSKGDTGNKGNKVPKTSDENHLVAWTMVTALCGLLTLTMLLQRKGYGEEAENSDPESSGKENKNP